MNNNEDEFDPNEISFYFNAATCIVTDIDTLSGLAPPCALLFVYYPTQFIMQNDTFSSPKKGRKWGKREERKKGRKKMRGRKTKVKKEIQKERRKTN